MLYMQIIIAITKLLRYDTHMNQVTIQTPRYRKHGNNQSCRVTLCLNQSTLDAVRQAIGHNGNLSAFVEQVMLERITKSYQAKFPDSHQI